LQSSTGSEFEDAQEAFFAVHILDELNACYLRELGGTLRKSAAR
jgi:hypothetical protein